MLVSEADARKIARYLFLHKWLAVSYSEKMEELLVGAIIEASKLDDVEGEIT